MKGKLITVVVMIVMLAAGFVLLGFAAYYYVRESNYLHRAVAVTGTVTVNTPYQYTGQDSYQTYTYFCPTIQFQTTDGANIESEAEAACSDNDQPAKYKVGQKVELFYDPKDPSKFTLKDFNDTYYAVYAYAVSGIVFLLVALVLSLVLSALSRKRQATENAPQTLHESGGGTTERDEELEVLRRLEQEELDANKRKKG